MSPMWEGLIWELNHRFPTWTIVHNKHRMMFDWEGVTYEFYEYSDKAAFQIAILCETELKFRQYKKETTE